MSAVSIFPDLNEQELELVLQQTEQIHLARGEYLMRQGDQADAVYYVLRGKFDILRDGRHVVAEIGAGEPVGEIAFFSGDTRTADVVAARDSEVLRLDRAHWDLLSVKLPSFHQSALRALGKRLAKATATAPPLPARSPLALVIAPVGGFSLPHELVHQIEQVFAEVPDTPLRVLSAADLPDGLGGADGPALSRWLAEHETPGRRLLLVTGQGNAAWDIAALHHCDHVLWAAPLDRLGEGPLPLSEYEAYAAPLFRDRQATLILWRQHAAQAIQGTQKVLQNRKVHLHHHIALDQREDFRRLMRFLTGRALGAVFGGGGAFGAAHIGALRALYGAGLRFDMAGGTSIGSTVAYALADHSSVGQMIHDFDFTLHKCKPLGQFTIPRHGLFDHRRTDKVLQDFFGDRVIEDFPLNAFSVAANLSTNALDVRRRGLAWTAVRASISIPGVLPPWLSAQGDIIVDGGIMDNVPLAVMRQLKTGPNMVFSLSASGTWRSQGSYSDYPSRSRLVMDFLRRRQVKNDLPRLDMVLARSMQVTSSSAFKNTHLGNDMLLELPSHPGVGLLSFGLAHKQEQVGYEFTARFIENMGGPEALMTWARKD